MKCFFACLVTVSVLLGDQHRCLGALPEAVAVKGMEEVLLPVRETTAEEQAAVTAAKEAFLARTDRADVRAWESYLAAHPASPYKLAVLTNLGSLYFRSAQFSKCLTTYAAAWEAGKNFRNHPAELLAGRAVGELALMHARLGHYQELEQLLKSVQGREFRGPGSNLMEQAQSGFELMKSVPETSFRCGPMALSRILASQGKGIFPLPIRDAVSTRQGMSLAQVKAIADQVGLQQFQVAKRATGAAILTPAVVHWKAGHYAALVREENGRFLVEDPTFGMSTPIWATAETLDAEGSGYFMVGTADLPAGWSAVAEAEAATVWGKGQTNGGDPDSTGPDDEKSGGSSGGSSSGSGEEDPCGMAVWSVHSMLVSLNIMDRPLGYNPPVGPPVSVLLTYNSRENETIATPIHTNFGPKWNFNCVAWVTDYGTAAVVNGGYGGTEIFSRGSNTTPGQFERSKRTYSMLVRYGPVAGSTFERTWPDGTKEVFGLVGPNGLAYRTQLIDAAGNTLEFQYNTGSIVALDKIVDELGQETVFEYANGGNKPTKVTDPFGRTATFLYDAEGRLTQITDMAGINSQFAYKAGGNFIQTLTTPYGSTQFNTGFVGTTRWLEATHPNGDLERMEFRHNAEGIPNSLGAVPENMLVSPLYNNFRNALHWDRKAMKDAPGDVSKAHLTHFLHASSNTSITSGLVESEKRALEGRVFYNYEGQDNPNVASASGRRTKIGRLLDDGTTQLYQIEFNEAGKATKLTDPLGRATLLTYAANLQDVVTVRQQSGAGTEQLASYTYNDQRLPLTFTDAAGNTTVFTYNPRGQLLTVALPNGQTTTYTYNANGYLTTIDGPLAGVVDTTTLTYDAKGRLATITDGAGLSLAMEYDNLDRMTKRTYPDGNYEQWTYEALSPKTFRSRSGAVLTYQHNSMQQLVQVVDSMSRKILIDWCKCGEPKAIVDPMGNMTRFFHDTQGRLTGKAFADGKTQQVQFEPVSGRVAKTIDEMGREQIYSYAKDGRVTGLSYGGTAPPTPAVTMAWDATYPRPTQMTDGSGTTVFGYRPAGAGQSGGGLLVSVDGPLANDTLTYTHDIAGRVTGQSINGVAQTFSLDAMGRTSSVTNPLGTFGYTFDGASSRLTSMTSSAGPTVEMTYFSTGGMKLLKDITNKLPGGAQVSKFSYLYNTEFSPSSIGHGVDGGTQQTDLPAYDAVQRLTGYSKTLSGGGTQTFGYTYDAAGNRLTETIDATTTTASVNVLNQLTNLAPPPAAAKNYEWDGAGRLAAVVIGTHRSEFSYDGFGRRVRILEKENGLPVADRWFVWAGLQIAEERNASNTVVKRFFAQGFKTATESFFYARDHLGSIREVVDGAGAIRARYDYDPFGRRVKISGNIDADFGYAGMLHHEPSQLGLTYARAYDPALGRWISRDPSGESSGSNLYAYVRNNPLRHTDLLGLDVSPYSGDQSGWGGQYGDMAINTGKVLAGTATFAGAAGALALTVAAAPLLAPAALIGGVAVTGGAVLWTGYSLLQTSRNLTLNSMGFQNDQDGNPIKDFWKICGDDEDPMIKAARAGRDVAALAGDIMVGKALVGWAGDAMMALPVAADMVGNLTGFMDLMPAMNTVYGAFTN